MNIDFNADVAEGIGNEVQLIPFVHSVNIACGAHAGDVGEMHRIVALALSHGVKIGAHPSFEDRENFGRVALDISPDQIYKSVFQQVFTLQEIVLSMTESVEGIDHVKPHGALYHQACNDLGTAEAIITATREVSDNIALVGLPGSILIEKAREMNCRVLAEGFADRGYHSDGSLVSRTEPKSLIKDPVKVFEQVKSMVNGSVNSVEGDRIDLNIDTICFHGDTPGAVELIKYCYEGLGL